MWKYNTVKAYHIKLWVNILDLIPYQKLRIYWNENKNKSYILSRIMCNNFNFKQVYNWFIELIWTVDKDKWQIYLSKKFSPD